MRNIVLIGMPGCGKTTLGRYLAELLERDFIDGIRRLKRTAARPYRGCSP